MFAAVNELQIYYESHGSGDPVLLIPGLGSDANTWATFLPAINDFKAIVMENRGSGRSSRPSVRYSTEQMADDAAGLLDQLGVERAHVIGKSMGAMIAQFLAARYPQKVRSLVLACSVLRHDAYGREILELSREVAEKAGLFAAYRHAFLLSYSRNYCMAHRERLNEVEALLKQIDSSKLIPGYVAQSQACEHHDASSVVSEIKAPTLVIVGEDDFITPPESSGELAAAIRGAQLKIFSGGHGFWREFPETVNPVVRQFLLSH